MEASVTCICKCGLHMHQHVCTVYVSVSRVRLKYMLLQFLRYLSFLLKLTKRAMCLNWLQVSHSQNCSVRHRKSRPVYTLRTLWFWYFTIMLQLYIPISHHSYYHDSWMFWQGVAYHIILRSITSVARQHIFRYWPASIQISQDLIDMHYVIVWC